MRKIKIYVIRFYHNNIDVIHALGYYVVTMKAINSKQAFTLIEVLISLSILLVLFPLVSNIFYSEIKKYNSYSIESSEVAQIEFAEMYLKKISTTADYLKIIGNTLEIKSNSTIYEVSVKNKKLYTMQTATRYLTTEPMLITNYQFIQVNENYYQIELMTQTNKEYLIQLVRY